MRLLFRSHLYEAEIRALAERRGIEFVVAGDEETLVRELPQADALLVAPSLHTPRIPLTVAVQRGRLRWIALTSAGYDVILRDGRAPGVVTTYAAGVYGPVVAEHALALLLASVRQIAVSLDRQRSETWDRTLDGSLRSIEDLTVAIVGFGAIGQHLARCLRPLGARIVGVNRSGAAHPLADAMFATRDLHAALAQSDAVVIAVTMSEETRHLIDAGAFAAMRPQTILVNVARGPVVDSAALRAAIAAGTIRGAGLDVTDPEPLPAGDPLWRATEAIVTPHVGGFGSRAATARLVAQFERNCDRFAVGEELLGIVP